MFYNVLDAIGFGIKWATLTLILGGVAYCVVYKF